MVAGRHLPVHSQDTLPPRPQTMPPVDSIPPPPPHRPQTPHTEPDFTPVGTSRSPATTPRHRWLEEIHNTPSPGPSKQRGNGGYEGVDDHSEDDLPACKRQKKAHGQQKENPIALLTTAIERNTQVIERQHRQSQELLERTAGAQQKMFSDLMGALREN